MPTAVERLQDIHFRFIPEDDLQDNLGLNNKLLNFTLNFTLEGREGHLGELLSQELVPAVHDFGETLEILGGQHDFIQDHWPG